MLGAMDFGIASETADLLARFKKTLEEIVYPLEEERATKSFVAMNPSLERARANVRERGLWAPQAPRELGGMGLPFLEHALVSEILGRSLLGNYVFGCPAPDAGNMEILHRFGTQEQQARWLVPLVKGEIRSCFSMTEPDHAGSNPTWLSTTAVRDGDQYVINGRKWFTTAADGAAFAIVMAVTDANAPAHARASQIIVPTDTPGFIHVGRISIMGDEGSGWESHSEIEYRDCRVPITNRIGEEGSGFWIAQERLGPGRIHHCMRWIGICERSFELMCKRAATREIAPGKPLGSRQIVQQWIADSRAEVDAARWLVRHAAWKIDSVGASEARNEISEIKYFVAGVLQRVVDRAIQTHGALGVTDRTPLSHFYRHERAARIYDGPDEVHKTVVARRALREYGLEL